jgi:hypothetical protein
MPDTMISSVETAARPSGAGILSDYRSPLIGQLVAARAKAASDIKRVVKDKKAEVQSRKDGRSYSYQYADLADVMEAVDDALAAHEMALFQTMQERRGALVLVTTLAHSSDQWIASEVRITSPDAAGPQVFGSALTYMRRYSALAILGIAPDADDDGKAAQDKADQRTRQDRQEPAKAPKRPTQGKALPAAPPAPSDDTGEAPVEPEYTPIPIGASGALYGRWTKLAMAILAGRPESFRRDWLEMHALELAEMRTYHPEWCDKVEAMAISPDLPEAAE